MSRQLGRNDTYVKDYVDPLTSKVIGCAIEVHKQLGPGGLESAYEECLEYELIDAGLKVERQLVLPLVYKKRRLKQGYKLDLLVEGRLIVEVKAVETLAKVHEAQLLTYLRLSGCKTGLLLNFHVALLKDGIKRMVL
jgi:GxxExxY protein